MIALLCKSQVNVKCQRRSYNYVPPYLSVKVQKETELRLKYF